MRSPKGRSGKTTALQLLGISLVAASGVALSWQPKAAIARDADPTFAQDVAPILFKNCTECHRPGGLGPFTLTTYDSAKKRVDDIKDAISTNYMPPWHAEGPHGVFRNDRRLPDSERQTILRWIETGAKPGDLSKMPPLPQYPEKWNISPDTVITMPEDFTVPAEGQIDYQYFEVPTNFTEDKWVTAIEFMPGARQVVHHVLVYARVPRPAAPAATASTPAPTPAPTQAGTPAGAAAPTTPPTPVIIRNQTWEKTTPPSQRAPATPPNVPLLKNEHPQKNPLGTLIGGTAPGTNVMTLVPGTALRIRAGTILTFQMHYTAKGHEMHDRTSVGFKFAKEMPDEEILASQFINGQFTIPANTKDVAIPSEITAGQPVKIWGLMPHTHLRGRKWQYTLEKPDGTSQVILDVPHYDFNWQTYYLFEKPLLLQPGEKIKATAWYDNTPSKTNPDAAKDVFWGDQTWEEMQYTGFLYSIPSRRLRPQPGQN
jgi:hypothetical protein